jgi:hypothetical protein
LSVATDLRDTVNKSETNMGIQVEAIRNLAMVSSDQGNYPADIMSNGLKKLIM